jgi:thioredoxin-related protein
MRSMMPLALALAIVCPINAADAFKPPAAPAKLKSRSIEGVTWSADLAAALEEARKDKKLVFIDFTGESCINCRVNEKKIFVQPEVKDLFKQYVRVQIYTDKIPADYYVSAPDEDNREKDAEPNLKFEKAVFKSEQLPLYVIVKPADGGQFEIVDKYDEGRISKADQFIKFLKTPLATK